MEEPLELPDVPELEVNPLLDVVVELPLDVVVELDVAVALPLPDVEAAAEVVPVVVVPTPEVELEDVPLPLPEVPVDAEVVAEGALEEQAERSVSSARRTANLIVVSPGKLGQASPKRGPGGSGWSPFAREHGPSVGRAAALRAASGGRPPDAWNAGGQ